jgi:hypothetical protein
MLFKQAVNFIMHEAKGNISFSFIQLLTCQAHSGQSSLTLCLQTSQQDHLMKFLGNLLYRLTLRILKIFAYFHAAISIDLSEFISLECLFLCYEGWTKE